MSQAEADGFARDMKTSTELQAKAKGGAIDDIVKISIARGYLVAAEELRANIISQKRVIAEDEGNLLCIGYIF